MKIDKNSWHYRLLTESVLGLGGMYELDVSRNLCKYCWQILGRLIKMFVECILFPVLTIIILVIAPLVSLGWGVYTGEWTVHKNVGLAILYPELILAIVLVTMLGCKIISNKVKHYRRSRLEKKSRDGIWTDHKKEPEPNLLYQFLKAKKDKVCPIIEFTEGE